MNPDDGLLTQFRMTQGATTLCQPCLTLALFAPELKGNEDLSGALRVFDARLRPTVGWCRDKPGQMHPKAVSPAEWTALRDTLLKRLRVGAKRGEVVELRAPSSTRDEWQPPLFELSAESAVRSNLHLRIALPWSWLTSNDVPAFESFIDEIVATGFPFKFGYAGVGLAWNRSNPRDQGALKDSFRRWSTRHPGLVAISPLAQIYPAAHGLVDIGWITLLGPAYANAIGGAVALTTTFAAKCADATIAVRELEGGGIAIRAGDWPQLGDNLRGDGVELQRTVGAALRKLWNKDANPILYLEGFENSGDYSAHAVWANRFFE